MLRLFGFKLPVNLSVQASVSANRLERIRMSCDGL